jgi:HPt (histidine-containing phosphotransfer) domain-containing protein
MPAEPKVAAVNRATFDGQSVYSPLAGDPAFAQIVSQFVSDLPVRVAAMELAFGERQFQQLRSLAHQLKGAAGSYGFDHVTEVVRRLEYAIVDERGPDEIEMALKEVIRTVARVRSGTPSGL